MLQHTGHSVAGTQPLIEVIEIPGRFAVFSPDLREQREMPAAENLVAAIGLTGISADNRTEAPTFDFEITPATERTRAHLLASHNGIFTRFNQTDNPEFIDLIRSDNSNYSRDPSAKVIGGTVLEEVDGEIREGIFVSKLWLPHLSRAVVNVSLAHYGSSNHGRPSPWQAMAKKLPRTFEKQHVIREAGLRAGMTMLAHTFDRIEVPEASAAEQPPSRHLQLVPDSVQHAA